MNNKGNKIPALLFVLFEIAVGVLLFRDPEGFSMTIIKILGIVSLAIGIVYLLSYFSNRKKYGNGGYGLLILSVPAIIIGAVCAVLPKWVYSLFAVAVVIYGIVLIVTSVFKTRNYFESKKLGFPVSKLTILSAVLSLILGIVITINPFGATEFAFTFAGISLIIEAVIDFIALIIV